MDEELKKSASRLIIGMINYFFSHTVTIIKGYGNRNAWTAKTCPLNNGFNHLRYSQLVFGLGKKEWKCELCGTFEFLEFDVEDGEECQHRHPIEYNVDNHYDWIAVCLECNRILPDKMSARKGVYEEKEI